MAAPSAQDVAIALPLMVSWQRSWSRFDSRNCAAGHLPFYSPSPPTRRTGVRFWRDVAIVSGATVLAGVAHLVEMIIWAVVFVFCGEFGQLSAAFTTPR